MKKKYAEIIINIGVNLQKGEELVISTPIFCTDLANLIAQEAYKKGAKRVTMLYNDENFTHLRYKNESIEQLTTIPDYVVGSRDYIVDNKACYVCILGDNPDLFSDIDSDIIAKVSKANHQRNKKFYDSSTDNYIKWCLVAYATPKWAKKVFPNLNESDSVNALWNKIYDCMRLTEPNPTQSWIDHFNTLKKRCDFLNSSDIQSLHYKNNLGTDFTVTLPQNYQFCGGTDKNLDGEFFAPNMPTEEVYAAPYKFGGNGVLKSTYPLIYNGQKITDLCLKIVDGKIVSYDASHGLDTLKGIIETDLGSHYLGEVALVCKTSKVHKQNILFYETLFDENASCHFAIGQAYNSSIKNGEGLNDEQLEKYGLNNSLVHVDFMVGSDDLEIIATKHNGEKFTIMKDGVLII